MVARRLKFRSFESLEIRYTFAGDVTTSIDGSGNLLILGDNFANGIQITQTNNTQFRLTGIDAGGTATNINGVSNGTVNLNGVTGKVTIRTLGGNDEVLFPYFNYAGAIVINVGDGNDHVVLGDSGAASFLVGGLSIRTGEGIDEISEGNINVIGYHDFAAKSTAGAQTPVGRHQELNIEGCTFGSLLYADFGGRRATLNITDVIVAGEFDTFNGQSNTAGVDYYFETTITDTSVGGALNVFANTTSRTVITDSTIIGKSTIDIVSLNQVSHYLGISDSLLGAVSTNYGGEFDTQNFGRINFSGNVDLKSNGSIFLIDVNGIDVTANSRVNENSSIFVGEGSTFVNLTLQTGEATKPAASAATLISIADITVFGTLIISSEGRVKAVSDPSPIGSKLVYNPNPAKIVISSATIDTLLMPRATSEPDSANATVLTEGPAGSIDFQILSCNIQTVNIRLPNSDDELKFGNTIVQQVTILDGGGFYTNLWPGSDPIGTGSNTLTINGGSLANLTKTRFI